MGEQDVREQSQAEDLRVFLRHLLKDVQAFERMLEEDRFETGVRRIGAEQELFLVDQYWRPAPIATEVLEILKDPHFTTELARFNLEFNATPIKFGGSCLRQLEQHMNDSLSRVREIANELGMEVVEIGRCPVYYLDDKPGACKAHAAMTHLTGTWGKPPQTDPDPKHRELW